MNDGKFAFTSILLIDDSEIDVLVNRRLMEIWRFSENIIIANSGEEGLQFLKTECTSADYAPDLILLNVHLPGMGGYEFIEEFKALPLHIKNKSKIVVLSAVQKQNELNEALQNSFVLTNIEKPLTQHSLKALITHHDASVQISEKDN
jgi:CheY-like chemotaxis protein